MFSTKISSLTIRVGDTKSAAILALWSSRPALYRLKLPSTKSAAAHPNWSDTTVLVYHLSWKSPVYRLRMPQSPDRLGRSQNVGHKVRLKPSAKSVNAAEQLIPSLIADIAFSWSSPALAALCCCYAENSFIPAVQFFRATSMDNMTPDKFGANTPWWHLLKDTWCMALCDKRSRLAGGWRL